MLWTRTLNFLHSNRSHPMNRLRIDRLEARDLPSTVWIAQPFDTGTQVPSDFQQWTGSGGTFGTSTARFVSPPHSLTIAGASNSTARIWHEDRLPENFGAAVSVFADSLIPTQVFVRGTNLNTAQPTMLTVEVTRGIHLTVSQVVNGVSTTLATLKSNAWLSGQWIRVSVEPSGDWVRVTAQRLDNGQFLASSGNWQTLQTAAITVYSPTVRGEGHVGINRPARYAGTCFTDDFSILSPVGTNHDFTPPAAGQLPSDWQQWSNTGAAAFVPSPTAALSPSHGVASVASQSFFTGSTWLSEELPANVKVTAAIFADTLIPGRVFARGSNLDSSTPTYYAVSVKRGIEVSLVRVVDGVSTNLGTVITPTYLSNQWLRVSMSLNGSRLAVAVQRLDTNHWLTPNGAWQANPTFALSQQDSTIDRPGRVGLARPAAVAGTLRADDFAVTASAGEDTTPPLVSITNPPLGAPLSGVVTVTAAATDNQGIERVEFFVNGVLRSIDLSTPYRWDFDTRLVPDGAHTLTVRAYDVAGNFGTAVQTIVVQNHPYGLPPLPSIPRHYNHIRIAQLAYSGNPMGSIEQQLLRESVDLVVANPRHMNTIQAVAPNTPQLVYSNISNLYLELLTDWLNFADRSGINRESIFYHVAQETAFTGNSPSSQPVTWFWNVARGPVVGTTGWTNLTVAARGNSTGALNFGGSGSALVIGYPERYREWNLTLARGAQTGWSGVVEYVSAVDAAGNPTQWRPLNILSNTTNDFRVNGRLTFDPPSDWQTSSINGSVRLYHIRIRATTGTTGNSPIATSLLGRDYVLANGTTSGKIPAFDPSADLDGDGYLNDAEYAARAPGKNARFFYESRLFYPFYGQMRFVTNPSSHAVVDWVVQYHRKVLSTLPHADGFFIDNSGGKLPFAAGLVMEPTASYGSDYAAVLGELWRALAPKWLMPNTAGGGAFADDVIRQTPASMEEFALRPMGATWAAFLDQAAQIHRRLSLLSPSAYMVLDSYPTGGSITDPRMLMGTLAYYYLVADPEKTFLMFFGGAEPSSTWSRHWTPAAAYNVGQPQGNFDVFATGRDPANTNLTYNVYSRSYENALVLYKPLSYTLQVGTGTTADNTATTHSLNGTYRVLRNDGTLGAPTTSITLRNGEGAVLIRI